MTFWRGKARVIEEGRFEEGVTKLKLDYTLSSLAIQ